MYSVRNAVKRTSLVKVTCSSLMPIHTNHNKIICNLYKGCYGTSNLSCSCSHISAGPSSAALGCEGGKRRKRTDGLNLVIEPPADLQYTEDHLQPF